MYSDAELAELLADGESTLVERKRNAPAGGGEAIYRTVCAFANDLAGAGRAGVVLVGVEDDGRCANLEIDDALLQRLAQIRSGGNIQPLPSLTVERRTVGGCEVAAIEVEPSASPPVRYRGRAWVRVGTTTQQANAEDERRLTERRRAADLSFDMRPVGEAALDEIDMEHARVHYLPQAIAHEVLEMNQRPLLSQLRSLRLVVGDRPTWGGLLGLGVDPQRWRPGAYVQFARFDGREIVDPILDRKRLTGRLEDVLRRLDDVLKINISTRVEVAAVPREERWPDYPVAALRQLAWNAVMHRQYDGTNAPVRVYWYADRVEIQNPGDLYGRVTPENFGQDATDYRNPLVAEIMHHLGFAQNFGLGIPLARRALRDNGNPDPEFVFGNGSFKAIARPAA